MQKPRAWTLFWSTFSLSAFTFGGGYVIVPLMKKKFADQLHWLTEEEMLDLIAIAQSSPGAIAVNAALMLGRRVMGVRGMLLAGLGAVLPPLLLLMLISLVYRQMKQVRLISLFLLSMRAGISAVIVSVVYDLARGVLKQKQPVALFSMTAGFALVWFLHVHVALVMALSALVAILLTREDAHG